MPATPATTQPRFRREKYKELLLYVAKKSEEHPDFGDTLLNKVLVYSDWWAFGKLGEAMTGQRVQRLSRGPTSRPLLPIREEMVAEGALSVSYVDHPVGRMRRTRAHREPDLGEFSGAEIAIVDDLIEQFSKMTATELSEWTHGIAWSFFANGEDIPYETVFFTKHTLSDDELQHAQSLEAGLDG